MVDGWWYATPRQIKQEDSLDKLATTLPAAYPCDVPTSLQTLSCLLLEIINILETTNYSTNKISWSLSLPLCDLAWAGKCSKFVWASDANTVQPRHQEYIPEHCLITPFTQKENLLFMCGLLWSEKCQYCRIKEQYAKQMKNITSKVLSVPSIH